MRLLSIVQWHHFAWMIISLALLGYGASGTAIAILRQRVEPRFEFVFALSALAFSISMLVAFAVGQRVPFNALEIVWDTTQFLNLALLSLVFLVPFLFAAFCVGLALSCRSDQIHRIYFVDLIGAGCGAALVISLLFLMPPQSALIVLAVLPAAGSILMSHRWASRHPLSAAQVIWLAALAVATGAGWPGLHISPYKGLSQALQVVDANVIRQVSSPLGLITVVDSPTVPVRHAPGLSFGTLHIPPQQLALFTDADSLSAITRYDGDTEAIAYLGDTTASLPYQLLQAPTVLVLGSGAGEDILRALLHGANRIDAVELDPRVVEIVRESPGGFSRAIYDDPRVNLHIAEARVFVARSEMKVDLVQIGLLDSFGASGAAVHALNESYVYTVEALQDYLDDLKPGGLLAITRWNKLPERDNVKLVLTAIEALSQFGAVYPGRQLVAIRSWNTSTLLLKNGEFTVDEVAIIRQFARQRSFDTSYFPGITEDAVNRYNVLDEDHVHEAARAAVAGSGPDFARRYKFFVAPATDDRPYFFHFFKWRTLAEVFALRKVGGGGLIEWGYLILLATLLAARYDRAMGRLLPVARTGFPVRRDGVHPEVHPVPGPSPVLGCRRPERISCFRRYWQRPERGLGGEDGRYCAITHKHRCCRDHRACDPLSGVVAACVRGVPRIPGRHPCTNRYRPDCANGSVDGHAVSAWPVTGIRGIERVRALGLGHQRIRVGRQRCACDLAGDRVRVRCGDPGRADAVCVRRRPVSMKPGQATRCPRITIAIRQIPRGPVRFAPGSCRRVWRRTLPGPRARSAIRPYRSRLPRQRRS
jgi:spermidine synthase